MALKYDPLDVMKMYATLTLEQWRHCLLMAAKSGNANKLIKWRYGLQAGLANLNKMGRHSDEKVDLWVMKRCRDVEQAMKVILKKKYPNPFDNPKADPTKYTESLRAAKKKRDQDFEKFLQRSNY